MKRYASIVGLKPESIGEYKRLHAAVWPEVLDQIRQSNVRNYSIFLRKLPDGNHYLFSYFEYSGSDFAADMAAMAANPSTQDWWDICKPLQDPLPNLAPGEWWADMEEVFYAD